MPLLKHAKKKLKQDKKRTIQNNKVRKVFKKSVKAAKAEKNTKSVSAAFKAIDKTVKANLIHKNKAARMKSALSKLVSGKAASATSTTKAKAKTATSTKPTPKAKKTVKKANVKKTSSKKK